MLAGRRVAQPYELADIVRYAGRCIVAAVSTVLCAVFLVAGTQVKSVPFAVIVLAGGAGALYLSQSSFWSVSADVGGSSAGAVSGVMNMGARLAERSAHRLRLSSQQK